MTCVTGERLLDVSEQQRFPGRWTGTLAFQTLRVTRAVLHILFPVLSMSVKNANTVLRPRTKQELVWPTGRSLPTSGAGRDWRQLSLGIRQEIASTDVSPTCGCPARLG